jgi:cold shock CspA family protein
MFVMIGAASYTFLAQLPCWRAGPASSFRCPHVTLFFVPTHQLRNTIMSSAERLTGILIKFDHQKGYGFIRVLGHPQHYFLHNKLIRTEQRTSVAVGRCLSFVPMKTERGLEAWAPSLIHAPAIAGD